MAASFEEWFNGKYGKKQSYGRGVALEAWNAAIKSMGIDVQPLKAEIAAVGCTECGCRISLRGYCAGCQSRV